MITNSCSSGPKWHSHSRENPRLNNKKKTALPALLLDLKDARSRIADPRTYLVRSDARSGILRSSSYFSKLLRTRQGGAPPCPFPTGSKPSVHFLDLSVFCVRVLIVPGAQCTFNLCADPRRRVDSTFTRMFSFKKKLLRAPPSFHL